MSASQTTSLATSGRGGGGACLSCGDSALSITASVVGILTFANSLLIGLLLFVSEAGRAILDSPDALRQLFEASEAAADELRDAQAWLEEEVLSGSSGGGKPGSDGGGDGSSSIIIMDSRRRRGTEISREEESSGISRRGTAMSRHGKEVIVEKANEDADGNSERANSGGDDDDSYSNREGDEHDSGSSLLITHQTQRQGVRLLDRAQLCFVASERYLERYRRILDDIRPTRQFFRKARFVAAREDVTKSVRLLSKALKDFRQFRNRVVERQTKRDRELLRQQAVTLQDIRQLLESSQATERPKGSIEQ